MHYYCACGEPEPCADLVDARFVLPQGAPAEERRQFMHALGLSVGDRPLPDQPEGTEVVVSFSLAAVPRADVRAKLDLLRLTLPSLELEEHPVGSFERDDAEDAADDEWDEDAMAEPPTWEAGHE